MFEGRRSQIRSIQETTESFLHENEVPVNKITTQLKGTGKLSVLSVKQ